MSYLIREHLSLDPEVHPDFVIAKHNQLLEKGFFARLIVHDFGDDELMADWSNEVWGMSAHHLENHMPHILRQYPDVKHSDLPVFVPGWKTKSGYPIQAMDKGYDEYLAIGLDKVDAWDMIALGSIMASLKLGETQKVS